MYLPKDKTGSIFIIGNSEERRDISQLIRKEDVVVRFNSPNITSSLKADVLFIANSSDMILNKDLIDSTTLTNTSIIVWRYHISDMIFSRYQPISLSKKLKYNLFFNSFKRNNNLNLYRQVYFPRGIQKDCISLLGCIASTGFLAIYLYMNLYPEKKIYLHNFTFSGWEGHNWDSEKKYVDFLVKIKKLILLNE